MHPEILTSTKLVSHDNINVPVKYAFSHYFTPAPHVLRTKHMSTGRNQCWMAVIVGSHSKSPEGTDPPSGLQNICLPPPPPQIF
jgi:hypothetical protein